MSKYKEIQQLFEYCKTIGVYAELFSFLDGYCIRFQNGGDVVQHGFSYGNDCGCVEFAIGCKKDYTAVSLKNAQAIIRRYKQKLNREQT